MSNPIYLNQIIKHSKQLIEYYKLTNNKEQLDKEIEHLNLITQQFK